MSGRKVMAFKMTLWVLCVMFVATMYNVVSAYSAMGSAEVQTRFQQIGLLHSQPSVPIPPRKPVMAQEFASN